jgi:1-acyl-sn-glycerol-3-phosphate acyltransferase
MGEMRCRTALLVLIYVVAVLLLIPVLLVCMLFGARAPIVAVGKWGMRVSRRVLGVPVDVRGLENVDATRPLVFMANHASFLDGPILFMLIPQPVRVIVKKGVGRIPIVGPGMRFMGFLTVDRKGAREGKARIETAIRAMKENADSFLVFPEGTRTRDGRLGPFRRGGFFLAVETGAPIVPIAVRGTFAMMPRGQWYVRRGRVRVDFLSPVPSGEYSIETMPALMDRVRTAIRDGLEKGDA